MQLLIPPVLCILFLKAYYYNERTQTKFGINMNTRALFDKAGKSCLNAINNFTEAAAY